MNVKVLLDNGAYMPTKAHTSDAGFDLYTKDTQCVKAHSYCVFDTGVHMLIPEGYVGFIKSKSGLNVKSDLVSEGVIDAGYTGSIVVKLYNHGNNDYQFHQGEKITQIVILPIPDIQLEKTTQLEYTSRGSTGFGASGK